MKTPEQIAIEHTRSLVEKVESRGGLDLSPSAVVLMRSAIQAAIKDDRAQPERDGTIHAATISALSDRADGDLSHAVPNERAAAWIKDNPDEFWDRYAGPMLDEIEADHRQEDDR